MDSGKKEGVGYIDGIPVKISEKYRPPRKVLLPVNFQNRLTSDVINFEYDFSLEKTVINDVKKKEAEKIAELEALRSIEEKLKSNEEGNNHCEKSSEQKLNGINTSVENESKIDTLEQPKISQAAPISSSSILQPITSSSVAGILQPILSSPSSNSTSNKSSSSQLSENFNPADFEGDTSSPFDNMELKTINELEELNTVFQTLAPCKNEDITPVNSSETSVNTNNVLISTSLPQTEIPNNVHYVQSEPLINENTGINGSSFHPCDNFFSSPDSFNYSRALETFSDSSGSNMLITHYSPVTVSYETSPFPSTRVNLRNSKSVSDLASMDSEVSELMDSKEQINVPYQRSRSAELHKSCENVSKPETPCKHSDVNNEQELDCELDAEQIRIVNYISDMGFPKLRVSRAVLIFGDDNKKIIDWLCLVQKFCEMGFSEFDVEQSLKVFDSDEEKIEEFLKSFIQLKSLGFDSTKVKNALISSKNDRDKALDILLS